ncbi:hypothetical protein EJ04DRAFT_564833 [Polyplosphaeria fusca]|uniref:Uncharacterized protein n=1 Tax=Polyplosphaeria fusca TaxID=682080 RepID=A0A9P4QYT5_9PLEO|nr:hypothetical protein EJ04DRAFT_564833 [Polyplosphaeria fusca]
MDVPWRIGNPPPRPYPLDTESEIDAPLDLFIDILKYVMAEQFQPRLYPAGVELLSHKGYNTRVLTVYSNYFPGCEDKWNKVLKWIVDRLAEDKVRWDVEIVDEGFRLFRPSIAVFNPKLADDLPKVSPILIQFGVIDWVSIDILPYFSPIKQSTAPTLMISLKDAYNVRLGPAIQEIKKRTVFEDVAVFQIDSALPGALDTNDATLYRPISQFEQSDKPYDNPIGGSCGIKDQQISATIGFPLAFNSSSNAYGITSARIFGTGLHLGATIEGPSLVDKTENINRAREEAVLNPFAEKHAERLPKIYDARPPHLGDIVATSHPEHGGWLTDWCIFKLDPKHEIRPKIFLQEIKPQVHLKDRITVKPNEWTALEQGKIYRVQRCGRSSGWTYGLTNPYPSLINIRGLHPQRDYALVYGVLTKSPLFSWGDMGSPVLTAKPSAKPGTLVGMCIGFNTGSELHYMTPMDAILQSVSSVIQQDVKQPKEIEPKEIEPKEIE